MRIIALLLVTASMLIPRMSLAQRQRDRPLSVHALLGGLAPTGRHRSVIGDAFAIGAQAGLGLRPSMALVAGVLVSQTSYRPPFRDEVTVVQYDLGLEFAPSTSAATTHTPRRRLTPFVGAGAGARSYNLRQASAATGVYLAGYLSGGAELAMGRAGLRLEARDYISRSELPGRYSGTRNDLALLAGMAYHFR